MVKILYNNITYYY